MTPDAPTPTIQRYEAVGRLRVGGAGQLEAHGLVTPFDATAGRIADLAGPADLLCAALSACILKNVERFSQLLPFRYETATVLVVAEREDPPPRIVRMRYELEAAIWDRPALCSHTNRTLCGPREVIRSAPSDSRRRSHAKPRLEHMRET